MMNTMPFHLSDSELISAVRELATRERQSTVSLIAHLAELEARRLYLPAGYRSLFVYCVRVLRLSEGGAYNRIEAARVARRLPVVLDLLEQGALNLTTLRLLTPHLTSENHEGLLASAAGKSKREVEKLLAQVFPKPDVAPSIRKLPGGQPAPAVSEGTARNGSAEPVAAVDKGTQDTAVDALDGGLLVQPDPEMSSAHQNPIAVPHAAFPLTEPARASSGPRPPLMTALSADRYQIKFTASAATCEKLRRAQDLLRHAVPDGDPAEIVDRALTILLADLEGKKFAATARPRTAGGVRSGSRTIPAAVRRAVAARDGGLCAFVGSDGHRCGESGFLEFHHVLPYAEGGPPTVENIQLRCRAHNAYEADQWFGRSKWSRGRRVSQGSGASDDVFVGRGLRSNSPRDELARIKRGEGPGNAGAVRPG